MSIDSHPDIGFARFLHYEAQRLLYEEGLKKFIEFHNRNPTFEEDASIFESITDEAVEKKLRELTRNHLPAPLATGI